MKQSLRSHAIWPAVSIIWASSRERSETWVGKGRKEGVWVCAVSEVNRNFYLLAFICMDMN